MTEEDELEDLFQRYPRLRDAEGEITSNRDHRYNCVAWSVGETKIPWIADPGIVDDPELKQYGYWPPGVPRKDTLKAWMQAFGTQGYRRCRSWNLEPGYEKVAIFGTPDGPTHAARQTPEGKWASKLGKGHDIEHHLEGLAGSKFGEILVILRRRLRSAQQKAPPS